MTAPATHPPLTRYHSQIESDVNSLLGVKDSHLLSIAITGLGGGAFLPAAGEKSLAEAQGGAQLQTQPAPSSVVDSTARCLFFAGLLLPFLLLALICLPRPQSTLPVSVRFWRIGESPSCFTALPIPIFLAYLFFVLHCNLCSSHSGRNSVGCAGCSIRRVFMECACCQ